MQDVTSTALGAVSGDFSLLELFWQAHIVVKLVMLGLFAASVWCWAIMLDKVQLFARTARQMDRFEETFWSGQSLDQLYAQVSERPLSGMSAVFAAAMREWKRSFDGGRAIASLSQRIDKMMDVALMREADRMERGLLVLATVGSAGPFVGLFGTVWGIMSSFQAIAASNSTNLAAVAPGIAEALLATALGLLAAIPAVIAYNRFSAAANRLNGRMEAFADELSTILSRQLDAQGAPARRDPVAQSAQVAA